MEAFIKCIDFFPLSSMETFIKCGDFFPVWGLSFSLENFFPNQTVKNRASYNYNLKFQELQLQLDYFKRILNILLDTYIFLPAYVFLVFKKSHSWMNLIMKM